MANNCIIPLGPVMNLTGMIPYESLNALQNPNIPSGMNCHLNGATRGSAVSGATAEQVFTSMLEAANKPSTVGDIVPTITVIWDYYPLKKQSSIAPDATAFRMRIPHNILILLIAWDGEGEDQANATAISDELKTRLSSFEAFAKDAFKATGEVKNNTGYANNGESFSYITALEVNTNRL